MYCWGRTADGQLGLGGIEEDTVSVPRWNKFLHDKQVTYVGCGLKHTVILLDDGTMYSCGSNENGQLGQDSTSKRPGLISALDSFRITLVACGHAHSVAIDNYGVVFTWGDNSFGQLGSHTDTKTKFFPMKVKGLKDAVITQVACGSNHTIAYSQDGSLYTWGENIHGQLGHSKEESFVNTPKPVKELSGLPVLQIAAGGAHNLVLTRSMYVFGWGRNNFKQLGLKYGAAIDAPTELLCLRDEMVRYIACGESHTAVLTQEGDVLTFGCATSGQLGHGSFHPPDSPLRVSSLLGKDICQVACGRMHTLAVDTTGHVYSFGQVSGGQLGVSSKLNISSPQLIEHDWTLVPPVSGGTLLHAASATDSHDQSKLEVPLMGTSVDPPTGDLESMDTDSQGGFSTQSSVEQDGPCANVSMEDLSLTVSHDTSEQNFLAGVSGVLTRVFAGGDQSFACIAKVSASKTKECLPLLVDFRLHTSSLLSVGQDEPDNPCTSGDHSVSLSHLSSPSLFNSLFLKQDDRVTETNCCVDITQFQSLFRRLHDAGKGKEVECVVRDQLMPNMAERPVCMESVRALFVLPVHLQDCHSLDSFLMYMKLFRSVHRNLKIHQCLKNWFFNVNCRDHLKATVTLARSVIHKKMSYLGSKLKSQPTKAQTSSEQSFIKIQQPEAVQIITVLEFLELFHEWNKECGYVLSHTVFHENLIFELVDLIDDFFLWIENKASPEREVVFCRYSFCLDARAKERLMMIESRIQMRLAINHAQTSNLESLLTAQILNDPSPMAYRLDIDRRTLIRDTMAQLVTSDAIINFKKPLLVSFVGEEGEDAGGVKKEFFTLLLNEILSPDFGMFIQDEESHMIWFRDNTGLFDVEPDHFVLIGIICGLAIYNSVIIDVPLPMAMYKKLLGWSPDLIDLQEMFPSVGHSLSDLMSYDGDHFTHTFDLNFTITRSVFGEVVTIDLVKDGANKVVTMANREDYCAAYIDYTFNSSVRAQFDAFKEGFMKVCDGKILRMMHPEELKTLMVGQQVVKWEELQEHMTYKNGYSPNHHTIRIFWEVFYELSNEQKRKFLMFYTGSNRIPITGVKNMCMLIQKMDGGPKCEKLPVAHTCFNVLDLPPYDTKDKMKQKVLQAINFTSGFGIV